MFIACILSRASTHGGSQLKHQKLKVGGYTEKELKWFNYPRTRGHPGCKVSCQGVPNQLASSLRLCFVEASLTVEKAVSCYKADRLVASLPSLQCSVVACSMQILCCRGRTLRMGPRTSVCEPLIPNIVAPKAHQNNHSYLSSADLPSDSLQKFSMVGGYTENLGKPQNYQNWGVGTCLGQYDTNFEAHNLCHGNKNY